MLSPVLFRPLASVAFEARQKRGKICHRQPGAIGSEAESEGAEFRAKVVGAAGYVQEPVIRAVQKAGRNGLSDR